MRCATFLFQRPLLMTAVLFPSMMLTGVNAGHSRYPYFDGGQSADGRFVVSVELVDPAAAKGQSAAAHHWKYTWKDNKTGETIAGKLEGLATGKSGVFEPVHGHVFIPPGGATFAVWNPNVLAFNGAKARPPKDLTASEVRDFEGFTHRLTIYKKSGEVVKRLDLKDFLKEDDWKWLYCYGAQVYWQASFPGLTRDNAPRVGYALYQISPDYSVLETLVGATREGMAKAKERNVTPPAPRLVRVDLVTGKFLDPTEKPADPNKMPVRPFKGELSKRGEGGMHDYIPSADPVRVEGTYKK